MKDWNKSRNIARKRIMRHVKGKKRLLCTKTTRDKTTKITKKQDNDNSRKRGKREEENNNNSKTD